MLSFCTQVTHLFHIMQSGSRKIFFLCFVQLFRLQSQSRKWRCQSTIRKVGTSYKYRYKYCIIKALLTIRELHTVCPWSEFQNQLSFSHYQFRARKPCHSPYFTIALLLRFSVLLSWFQPIFVLFVAISAILCHCLKVMSLSEFYQNRAPFRLRVVPHFFSGVIFTRLAFCSLYYP